MKLNLDCMRDILLTLEGLHYEQFIHYTELSQTLPSNYEEPDICYSILKLAEAGYIKADIFEIPGGFPKISVIYDITYIGHEFLNSVRPKSVWQKISPFLKKYGITSLQIVGEIAQKLSIEVFLHQLL